MHDPETLEAFEQAPIGELDAEIKLAKANLDWAVKQQQAAPLGGVVIHESESEHGSAKRIRLWSDIVAEHTDKVRKLEIARAQMLQGNPATGDLIPYQAWLAKRKSKKSRRTSRQKPTR